jgi:hypothetical protein
MVKKEASIQIEAADRRTKQVEELQAERRTSPLFTSSSSAQTSLSASRALALAILPAFVHIV